MQAVVQTEGASKDYADVTAVAELDLVVERGQRVALIGHPGSGKTTLLRLLIDLESVDELHDRRSWTPR